MKRTYIRGWGIRRGATNAEKVGKVQKDGNEQCALPRIFRKAGRGEMMQEGGGDMSCNSTCVRRDEQISISRFNFPRWPGKTGWPLPISTTLFSNRATGKKCQQAAFNASAAALCGCSRRFIWTLLRIVIDEFAFCLRLQIFCVRIIREMPRD